MTCAVSVRERESLSSRSEFIESLVEETSALLPEQAPLNAFVHNNPLHSFEYLPFEQAAITSAAVLGCEPFPSEEFFADCLRDGRIRECDLEVAVEESNLPVTAVKICDLGRGEFVLARLRSPIVVPQGPNLDWHLSETRLLTEIHPAVAGPRRGTLLAHARRRYGPGGRSDLERKMLADLWRSLESVAPPVAAHPIGPRPRDRVCAAGGIDADTLVHPILIRFCAAFLDQGIAYWQMPGRDLGFLAAFRYLYGLAGAPPDSWMRGFGAECRRQASASMTAGETVEWALAELGVPESQWPTVISATLLSLRGWAGMVRQFERHPEIAPVGRRQVRLIEYLAVQLLLDVFAYQYVDKARSSSAPPRLRLATARRTERLDRDLVCEGYLAAQFAPVDLAQLEDAKNAREWLDAIRELNSLERRRLLHLAYERRHRIGVLDGLLAHDTEKPGGLPPPRFQAVFCIDEREESLRRHLEEVCPTAETFGYAGFFGVAMAFQGLDDIHSYPLCPVSLRPAHLVVETPLDADLASRYRSARRRQGTQSFALAIGSRSLVRGGLITAGTGLLSVIPLIAHCLSPRFADTLSHRFRRTRAPAPPTRLRVANDESEAAPNPGQWQVGYTTDEMASIVASVLSTMGLSSAISPLVLVVGHGSSSLNNPHQAAYNCGATGGGSGGPNARAFAAMANRADVREALAARGVAVPADTWFIGACHNTCDDTIEYYDTDLVPQHLENRFQEARTALESACAHNAHERCRRFGPRTAPVISMNGHHRRGKEASAAMARVASRAVDLAQPRPEYGHATNAVCIVGRRARTRGLFLDRRAFLVSYDPSDDPSGERLADLLHSVGPVAAGINLEYYFSAVDPAGNGCGTKLPHNIVGLIGVMDGHASDLRTGLACQMVEIHEPVRLLLVVEADPDRLLRVMATRPVFDRLVRNRWVQLASWSPQAPRMYMFSGHEFVPYEPEKHDLPTFEHSAQFYAGNHGHLGTARLTAAFGEPVR